MNFFPRTPNIDFLGHRKAALTFSLALGLLIIVWPLIKTPNWGVDFGGGNEIQVQFGSSIDAQKVREAIEGAGFGDASIQQFGDPAANEFLIRVGRSSLYTNEEFASKVEPDLRAALPELEAGTAGVVYDATEGDVVALTGKEGTLNPEKVKSALEAKGYRIQDVRSLAEGRSYSVLFRGVSDRVEQALNKSLPDSTPQIRRVEQVGASVGSELKLSAIKALLLSLLLILLYVGFRFNFAFATGAIVSLIHDAMLVVGFYLFSGAELNNTTIAAVLTIIGYSVNDKVVIFDRIRENMGKHKGRDLYRMINESVNETLSRTVVTNLTVILSLVGLIVFTAGTLRDFSLGMLVGMVTGTYSSTFIAAPIVIWLDDVLKARNEGAGRKTPPTRVATNP